MDQPNFRLDGQVALVTGASRGIGHDLVLALAGAGATVAAGARRSSDVEDLVTEVEAAGGRGMAVELDVTEQASIDAAVQRITDEAGQIDVLVNNAGLGFNHDAVDITEADWDAMMDVNLKGLFFITQAVARGMIDRRYGRIVSLSSQASLVGIPRHAIYSASKGGVNQLTRVLALEWSPFGVTVNAVAPTFIRTPGTAERLDDPNVRGRCALADPGRPLRHDGGRRRGRSLPRVPGRRARHGHGPQRRRRLDVAVGVRPASSPARPPGPASTR